MIKHFCDRCESSMEVEDRNPFIRLDNENGIYISVLPVTGDSKPIPDICRSCIVSIVTQGQPVTAIRPIIPSKNIATSQITPMPIVVPPTSTVATLQPLPEEKAFNEVQAAPVYELSKPESEN